MKYRKQMGFTVAELLGAICAIAVGLCVGGLLFAGVHFIAKFW
jgi:hypothetical protein